jgi:hypothetical protein
MAAAVEGRAEDGAEEEGTAAAAAAITFLAGEVGSEFAPKYAIMDSPAATTTWSSSSRGEAPKVGPSAYG